MKGPTGLALEVPDDFVCDSYCEDKSMAFPFMNPIPITIQYDPPSNVTLGEMYEQYILDDHKIVINSKIS